MALVKIPKVVDIYHGNRVQGFGNLTKAGIWGLIHKASQGASYKDPAYLERRPVITSAGLLHGAYHFGTGDNVKSQVDNFLTAAAPSSSTLLALDWEDPPKGSSPMTYEQAVMFVQMLVDKLGRYPVLYSGNRVKDLLGKKSDPVLSKCRFWLAQYSPQPITQASWPKGPWLWQYTEAGRLPGTDSALDFNAYDGSQSQLASDWASQTPNVVQQPFLTPGPASDPSAPFSVG